MVLFLLGLSGYQRAVQVWGSKVILKTEPIDPRSIFRGDYVRLSYTINTLSDTLANFDHRRVPRNYPVYVSLEKGAEYWKASGVYTEYPELPEDRRVIKGKLKYSRGDRLRLSYPVETYFIPEGTGEEIEKYRGRGLKVEIALSPTGHAVICRLIYPE
jgi:uncharacterized membrane-anchored protein